MTSRQWFRRNGLLKSSILTLFVVVAACAVGFIGAPTASNNARSASAVADEYRLSPEDMKKASDMYFNTCAGCHGTTRKGATGPNLEPERLKTYPQDYLVTTLTNGKPGGMPDWGRQGILSADDIQLMAKFLRNDPPAPPEMGLEQMEASRKVFIDPDKRPKKPEHKRNIKNFMGIVLRDMGKVAIVDGDTKELVNIVETGFAVHILRTSASGRYFYSIGRDGKTTLIDLWMAKPDKVAEIKVANEARSVEVSKYKGKEGNFMDKYVIVGGYSPAHFVIMDGETLKPLKIFSTSSYSVDKNEFAREARVASIVASHFEPSWIVNVKETGLVWIVDYAGLKDGRVGIHSLDAEKFLHDGGWDVSKRYFLVAANAMNKVVAVDAKEKKVVATIDVGIKPHPGRGANIANHPQYGNLWLTGHLGDNTVACISTPTPGKKEPWKAVKFINIPGEGGGNLFIKTHPKSNHIWVDRALNPKDSLQRSVFVVDKKTLEPIKQLIVPAEYPGRAVHLEYNEKGDEVWVAVWGRKDQVSAILIYDDKTMALKKVLKDDWVRTPTGHFNVYNTQQDVY